MGCRDFAEVVARKNYKDWCMIIIIIVIVIIITI